MNRGGKLLSVWLFIVLGIIALGVIAGVVLYYSVEIEVREAEAGLLANKISDCIISNEKMDLFLNEYFNIYKGCGLNEKLFGEGSNFFFKVQLIDSSDKVVKETYGGQQSFEKDCGLSEQLDARSYAKCVTLYEPVLYWDGQYKNGFLKVSAGSNQKGRVISALNDK